MGGWGSTVVGVEAHGHRRRGENGSLRDPGCLSVLRIWAILVPETSVGSQGQDQDGKYNGPGVKEGDISSVLVSRIRDPDNTFKFFDDKYFLSRPWVSYLRRNLNLRRYRTKPQDLRAGKL